MAQLDFVIGWSNFVMGYGSGAGLRWWLDCLGWGATERERWLKNELQNYSKPLYLHGYCSFVKKHIFTWYDVGGFLGWLAKM